MKAGVWTSPWGVERMPARAGPEVASSANRTGASTAGLAVGLAVARALAQARAAQLGLELRPVPDALSAVAVGERLGLLHARLRSGKGRILDEAGARVHPHPERL